MIPQLGADPASRFPEPASAIESPDGLLAWGGDLDPVRLTNAYRAGIFPWYSDEQPILWWSPSVRCVIFPDKVHISKRLQRLIGQNKYRLTANKQFEEVVRNCAKPRPDQEGTWITEEMISAYCRLQDIGIAHSIEVWQDNRLVGGIYGNSIGRMFFGESMFSHARDASKVALVALCRLLNRNDFAVLDCQITNPHLITMGAQEIPRETFLAILSGNIDIPVPENIFESSLD